jgi:hypothetical protein
LKANYSAAIGRVKGAPAQYFVRGTGYNEQQRTARDGGKPVLQSVLPCVALLANAGGSVRPASVKRPSRRWMRADHDCRLLWLRRPCVSLPRTVYRRRILLTKPRARSITPPRGSARERRPGRNDKTFRSPRASALLSPSPQKRQPGRLVARRPRSSRDSQDAGLPWAGQGSNLRPWD